MKSHLIAQDITTSTWARMRAGLVQELWRLRAELEKELAPEETLLCRNRIRFVKELLHVDPRKDDYALEARATPPHSQEFLSRALQGLPVLEEELGDMPVPRVAP